MLVGALEGAMLVARAYGDPARFTAAAELLLHQLEDGRDRGAAARVRGGRKPQRAAAHAAAARPKGAGTRRARVRPA
jgi:hypothetical protein